MLELEIQIVIGVLWSMNVNDKVWSQRKGKVQIVNLVMQNGEQTRASRVTISHVM